MLSQNVVERFGFLANPFDTAALSLSGQSLLPISKAFVGRDMGSVEFKTVTNILRLVGGNRFVIEGETGVGKTTFVNYHRYLWENESRDKLLTPNHELVFDAEWTAKDFLMNILSVLIRKLVALHSEKILKKSALCRNALLLTEVYARSHPQLQGSVLGLGAGFGTNEVISVPDPTDSLLFSYFRELVEEIKTWDYKGIFLHVDNFEQTAAKDTKKVQNFFHRVRDILQTQSVYFAFVGYPGFYREIISPIERVRSIFFTLPIYVPPLSEAQVLELIAKRYQILARKKFIKPVEDAFISYLYQLYDGKIRSILDSLATVVANFPDETPRTLEVKEARESLTRHIHERISSMLSPKALAVLQKIATLGESTNAKIARQFRQKPQSITPVIQELEKHHFIYTTRCQGREIFYKVDEIFKILQDERKFESVSLPASLLPSPYVLSEIGQKFMEILEKKPRLTLKEFCAIAHVPLNRARREVKELLEHQLIRKHGFTRGLYYTTGTPRGSSPDARIL